MSTFIQAVNRLLRINTIISGDDDDITTFSDSQHAADISLAQIAIQSELTEVISDRLIGYEKDSDSITLLTGTRTYALDSGFIRFYGKNPSFYDSTDNVRYYEYNGGEDVLRDFDYLYKTTQGGPIWWYWVDTTSKTVGFYNVPSSAFNNRSLSYDFETSVMVTNSSDTMPFHNVEEFYTFIDMASRRFRFLITKQPVGELPKDATYSNAKSRLYALMRPTNPSMWYGSRYG
jgi:hypothetical protein